MTDSPEPDTAPPSTTDSEPNEAGREVDQLVREANRMARSRPLLIGFIIGLVIAVGAAVFIIQNTDKIEMQWLWFDFTAPTWQSLGVAFFAGALASPLILLGIAHLRRRRAKLLETVGKVKRGRQPRHTSEG